MLIVAVVMGVTGVVVMTAVVARWRDAAGAAAATAEAVRAAATREAVLVTVVARVEAARAWAV